MDRIAKTAAWLFAPSTPEREGQEEQKRQRQAERLLTTPLFKEGTSPTTDGNPAKQREKRQSKRKWSEPMAADKVHQMVLGDRARFKSGQCCMIRCTERFAGSAAKESGAGQEEWEGGRGSYNTAYLSKEQDAFRELGTEQDRKAFISKLRPPAQLAKGSMMAAGSAVCNFAFQRFFGVTSSLISSVKGTPKARASASVSRTVVQRTRDHDKRDGVITFLEHLQRTRGQAMPNSSDTYLYMRKKKEVYGEYRKYYEEKTSLRDLVGIDGELCSQDYFYKTWKETYPNLKLRADGDFMKCQLCSLHKGEIFGGGAQDTARMEVLRAKYDEHLKDVQLDREVIAKLRVLSREARSRGTPHLHVLISCDGANQSNFATPLFATRAHGIDDKGWSERGKVYGVLVDDVVMDVLFVPQILGGGTNLVATALYNHCMFLTAKWGNFLGDVTFQVDNTVSENKNNFLMGFLSAMISRGVMKTATLYFMMVGHTHVQIDQAFSCFSKHVKGKDIFSKQQMAAEFQEAYRKVEVRCQILENMANFKDLVTLVTRRIHLITNFQGFRLFREGDWIVVMVKLKMHHEDWLGFSSDGKKVGSGPDFKPWRLMRCNDVRLEETPPYKLKKVPDEVIHQVQLRQEASWARLPAAFPADYDRHEQVKQEHRESIRTLKMTGSRPFDLDTAWLPPLEIDDNDEDDDPSVEDGGGGGHGGSGSDNDLLGSSDDSSSSDESLDGSDERLQQEGLRRRSHGTKKKSRAQEQREIRHGTLNTFAFFKTAGAPFLMGKVREERVMDGEREVSLHWYTPAKRRLVDDAANTSFDKYAAAVFTADFVKDTSAAGGSGRPKLVADASWEQVSSIVATCPALIAGGRKIPAWVKQTLKGEAASETDGHDDISTAGDGDVRVGSKRKHHAPAPAENEEEEEEKEETFESAGPASQLQQRELTRVGPGGGGPQRAGVTGQEKTARAEGTVEQRRRSPGGEEGQSIGTRRTSKRGCMPRKKWGSDEDDDRVS